MFAIKVSFINIPKNYAIFTTNDSSIDELNLYHITNRTHVKIYWKVILFTFARNLVTQQIAKRLRKFHVIHKHHEKILIHIDIFDEFYKLNITETFKYFNASVIQPRAKGIVLKQKLLLFHIQYRSIQWNHDNFHK